MFRSLFSSSKNSTKKSHHKTDKYIFPTVNPKEDGPDCLRDCSDCTVHYPSKFNVDTHRELYGGLKPVGSHLVVATGRSDWKEKVEREEGTLMEALHESSVRSKNGRIMVSASNIQPYHDPSVEKNNDGATTVLILPAFTFVDNVTGADIPELIKHYVDTPTPASIPVEPEKSAISSHRSHLRSRDCVHDYVVLLCSHKRRDARCGTSAPLIKKELERHLRPLGLHRDADDERPRGVGIYFVSHVGGHKFAANVLVYRRQAGQLIWLARIRPEHCEGIVKYTLLQGKVVHPESQLRGGFDRERGLTSW